MSLASRKAAARVLQEVYANRSTVDDALETHQTQLPPEQRPWVRSACFETLRYLPSIRASWQQHVKKKPTDPLALAILDLGTVQIQHLKTPPWAAVNETVTLTRALKKPHLSGLVNSVLRKIAKNPLLPTHLHNEETRWNHPKWWIKKLQQQWPKHWQAILQANNHKAPFWLRHNRQVPAALPALQKACPEARQHPHIASAWCIDPRPVASIPGFEAGHFSVQDAHAQRAAPLLDPHNGERILDACAAPGGKAGHLWEQAPQAEITAIDVQAHRLSRVGENLRRLQANINGTPVEVRALNMAKPNQWPPDWGAGAVFDRILLDVPCSASGVVRRHPDIKYLRQAGDIAAITRQQKDILEASTRLLKPGGHLLYATCSVFDEENGQQVAHFLSRHPEFEAETLSLPGGVSRQHGVQLLPEIHGGDGFYYALLKKRGHG